MVKTLTKDDKLTTKETQFRGVLSTSTIEIMHTAKTKQCARCKKKLPVKEFNKSRSTKDKLDSYCRGCRRQYSLDWRNSERGRKIMSDYLLKNKERLAQQGKEYRLQRKQDHRLRHKYGITLEQHKQIYSDQGGQCFDCGEPIVYEDIFVDFNPKAKKVEGLIGKRCYLKKKAERAEVYKGLQTRFPALRNLN